MFILKRANYEELLTRIRTGVTNIGNLVNGNVKHEGDRRRRMRGKVSRLFRSASSSIYNALRSTMACKCPSQSHDVGLRLEPRAVDISAVPKGDDQDIMTSFRFTFAMSFQSSFMDIDSMDESWRISSKLWNGLVLQPIKQPEKGRPARQKGGVRFALPDTEIRTPEISALAHQAAVATFTMGTLWTPVSNVEDQEIRDLCQAMRRSLKQRAGACCGNIKDPYCVTKGGIKYGVYPLGGVLEDQEGAPLVSLRDAITAGIGPSPYLRYADKLRLACAISSSVLQLYGTPWIAKPPQSADIFIVQRNGVPQFTDAYVLRRLPEFSNPPAIYSGNTTQIISSKPALFSLGILLLELLLGRPIEGPSPCYAMDEATMTSLLNQAHEYPGPNYENAVRRCIRSQFNIGDNVSLENDDFRDQLFAEVVVPLAEDLKACTGSWD